MYINLNKRLNRFAPRRFRLGALLLCSSFGLSLAHYAHSLPSDSDQELTLEAVSAEFDEARGMTTYSGQVVMQQGSMIIRADKLVIFGKLDSASKVIATGKPAKFQQTAKVDAQPVKASANKLEYEVNKETLVLVGNAALDQEGSSLKSNQIEYDVKKALVKAGSKPNDTSGDGRVRMVIPPKVLKAKKEEAAKPATPTAEPQSNTPKP